MTNPIPQHIKDKIAAEANKRWPTMESHSVDMVQLNDIRKASFIQGAEYGYNLSMEDNGWIEIGSGSLPNTGERVLICTTSGLRAVGYILNGEWNDNTRGEPFSERGYVVSHYRPLPSPPSTNQVKG